MNFTVVRDRLEVLNSTKGRLYAGDLDLYTLELPWKDDLPSVSCIPTGTYPVVIAWSNRYQRLMPRLLGVPKRDGILIHPGNTALDTAGCILVGMERTEGGTLQDSREAFKLFFDWLGKEVRNGEVNLEVSYAGPV